MESSAFWTNSATDRRGNKGSVFTVILRLMAAFVSVDVFLTAARVGPISVLGYITVLLLIPLALGIAYNPKGAFEALRLLFFWNLFLLWMCISFLVSGITYPQPPIANAELILIMVFVALAAAAAPGNIPGLHAILRWAFLVNAVLSLVVVTTRLFGPATSPRGYAIVAVLGLAVTLSYWRHGHPAWFFASVAIWLVVAATFSRTATIWGALLFPLSASRLIGHRLRWFRMLFIMLIIGVVFYAAVATSSDFENRWFFGRSAKDFVNGKAKLDTAGRAEMWQAVIDSWSSTQQTIFIGQGAGTSEDAASRGVPSMNHPHNDYLALLHDYGVIGCSFFVLGLIQLIRGRWRAWGRAEAEGSSDAFLHSAAFMITLGFAIMMITDNPLEYLYAVLPTALVVGTSLGAEIKQQRSGRLANFQS